MHDGRVKIALERLDSGEALVVRAEGRGWLRRRRTELRVDAWGVTATGDLGGYQRGMLRLPWEKLTELHFAPAESGAVEGLYVCEGQWCSRCVLPWISDAEAEAVIAAVARQYPRKLASLQSTATSAVAEAIGKQARRRWRWSRIWERRHVPAVSGARA